MLERLKTPLIPAVLIILLLGLYFTRWDKEVTLKSSEPIQNVYIKDRWTGQRWVLTYGNTVTESPILDNYAVLVYSESVKQRPDVVVMREEKIAQYSQKMHTKTSSSYNSTGILSLSFLISDIEAGYVDYEKLDRKWKDILFIKRGYNPTPETLSATRKIAHQKAITRINNEIENLAIATAKLDLGNKAWAKRKYYYWAWDGLMALSVLWLFTTLLLRKKNARAA